MALEIIKDINEERVTVTLKGRLDTTTAPELEAEFGEDLNREISLIFDMKELEYISSAGLRTLLNVHKKMMTGAGLKLINVGETVGDVLDVTGFCGILDIE